MATQKQAPGFWFASLRVFDLSVSEMLWSRRTIFMGLVVGVPVLLALRSLETRRSMPRPTDDGPDALIDPSSLLCASCYITLHAHKSPERTGGARLCVRAFSIRKRAKPLLTRRRAVFDRSDFSSRRRLADFGALGVT